MGSEYGVVEDLRLTTNVLVSMRAWKLLSKPELYEALLLIWPRYVHDDHFPLAMLVVDEVNFFKEDASMLNLFHWRCW